MKARLASVRGRGASGRGPAEPGESGGRQRTSNSLVSRSEPGTRSARARFSCSGTDSRPRRMTRTLARSNGAATQPDEPTRGQHLCAAVSPCHAGSCGWRRAEVSRWHARHQGADLAASIGSQAGRAARGQSGQARATGEDVRVTGLVLSPAELRKTGEWSEAYSSASTWLKRLLNGAGRLVRPLLRESTLGMYKG